MRKGPRNTGRRLLTTLGGNFENLVFPLLVSLTNLSLTKMLQMTRDVQLARLGVIEKGNGLKVNVAPTAPPHDPLLCLLPSLMPSFQSYHRRPGWCDGDCRHAGRCAERPCD